MAGLGVFFIFIFPHYSRYPGMFSLWMLGVKTSNLNIILCLAGVSAKPQGVPLVTILIFTVGSSLCPKLMILSSFQDLLVQPTRSDFREFSRKKERKLQNWILILSWKLNIASTLHCRTGRSCYCSHGKDDGGGAALGIPGPHCWWGMLGMWGVRETTGRACLSQSPMNTILGKMRRMSLVLGVLGVLAPW